MSDLMTQAANEGAALTGLPADFVLALIKAEQPESQLQQTQNPFDITKVWADLTGFGNIFAGFWNTNPGVIFSNSLSNAVKSWAQGINTFSNYDDLRKDLANPNTTIYDLAYDLQKVGYAGNSRTYAKRVSEIYQEISGKSADIPITLKDQPTQTKPPITTKSNPPNPSSNPSNVSLSFGQGILHLLIAFVLIILAIVSIIVGLHLIAPSVLTKNAPSVLEAITE